MSYFPNFYVYIICRKIKMFFSLQNIGFCVFTFVFHVSTSQRTPLSRPAALICNANASKGNKPENRVADTRTFFRVGNS